METSTDHDGSKVAKHHVVPALGCSRGVSVPVGAQLSLFITGTLSTGSTWGAEPLREPGELGCALGTLLTFSNHWPW